MDRSEEQTLAHLVFDHRWGALATQHDKRPLASYIAYVAVEDGAGVLIHVSRLAQHTVNLLENPQASLAISEMDRGDSDPQTLARVTLQGSVSEIPRDAKSYATAQAQYLKVLPDAQQLFSFADFVLFRLSIERMRFVAGFGKSYTLSAETLQRIRQV